MAGGVGRAPAFAGVLLGANLLRLDDELCRSDVVPVVLGRPEAGEPAVQAGARYVEGMGRRLVLVAGRDRHDPVGEAFQLRRPDVPRDVEVAGWRRARVGPHRVEADSGRDGAVAGYRQAGADPGGDGDGNEGRELPLHSKTATVNASPSQVLRLPLGPNAFGFRTSFTWSRRWPWCVPAPTPLKPPLWPLRAMS